MNIDWNDLTEASGIDFGVFSENEILELSALEITNVNTLDILNQPSENGLYDRRMGPNDKWESCSTCKFSKVLCPGHHGHISLPLPVFNSFFYNQILLLLKATCLKCNQVVVTRPLCLLFIYQMKCIKLGYIELLPQLKHIIRLTKEENENPAEIIEKKLKNAFFEVAEAAGNKDNLKNSKYVQGMKLGLIKQFLRKSRKPKTCPHCSCALVRPSKVNGIFVVKSKRQSGGDEGVTFNLNASEVKKHFRLVYNNNQEFFHAIFAFSKGLENPTDIFFIEKLLVAPNTFRQADEVKGQMHASHRTLILQTLLGLCQDIKPFLEETENPEENMKKANFDILWKKLQAQVDQIYDSNLSRLKTSKVNTSSGIRQVLEKKEGVFRKCMMAKRVDFCARSVIAPDPLIHVNEIGIPIHFAKNLTFPEVLNDTNKEYLKELIIRGPDSYPGAKFVEINGAQKNLSKMTLEERTKYAEWFVQSSSDTPDFQQGIIKKVLRHIIDGDYVLGNRQPTLHKPSLMAHKVRVSKVEKTLRLHYSNCKSYNADFDGDELNVHFPQSLEGRAEASHIAAVEYQYLSPKDGSPLGGLIQDFIVSSTRMTLRGATFTKAEYERLVFAGLYFLKTEIKFLPPAYIRPQKLWTGKQIFSTLILNLIPEGKKAPNLEAKTKVDESLWTTKAGRPMKAGGTPLTKFEMSESYVIIREGEIMSGVVDKAMIGASSFGVVHLFQELYGGVISTRFISALTFMLTCYLNYYGFSLELDDFLLKPEVVEERQKILNASGVIGTKVYNKYLALSDSATNDEIKTEMRARHHVKNSKLFKELDGLVKKETEKINKSVAECCFPTGLLKTFPQNNLQLIIQTGAKGSTVNAQQISCLLGQIELEGKRVPTMITGATLPPFREYESDLSSGGFVTSSFGSSLCATEFFFHSMAGREGLCDTAVKTATSGYLQRCLVKHLESMYVAQDLSVRENDGTLLQPLYGGDGLQVEKSQILTKDRIGLLAQNFDILNEPEQVSDLKTHPDYKLVKKEMKKICKKLRKEDPNIDEPVLNRFNSQTTLGCISENLENIIENFISKNPVIEKSNGELYYSDGKKACNKTEFTDLVHYRALRSQIEPGEHVGILAAQSIGEPSTQMTLNTFHFAGRGDMNVTLGIPRLKEILLSASKKISTPSMDLFLTPDCKENEDEILDFICKGFTQVKFANVIHKIDIEKRQAFINNMRRVEWVLEIFFMPSNELKGSYNITLKTIFEHLSKEKFYKDLEKFVTKCYKLEKRTIINESMNEAEPEPEDEEGNVAEEKQSEEESEDEREDAKERQTTNYDSDGDDGEAEKDEDNLDVEEPENKSKDEEVFVEEETDPEGGNEELNKILAKFKYITGCILNKKKRYCKMTFRLSEPESFLQFENIICDFIKSHVIREVPKITRAFPLDLTNSKGEKVTGIKTEGENLKTIEKFAEYLDLSETYSNNIKALERKFGVEVSRAALIKEIHSVFAMYGIFVNPRHIMLVADYMASSSKYRACNRGAMASSAAPMQQITFETAMEFLQTNLLHGNVDYLESVSSKIAVGQRLQNGTTSNQLFILKN